MAPDSFLLGMERPKMAKMAIFGCFRQNIGISLIEYEGLGPETCTKPVGIPGEAFYVVFGHQIRFF